MTLEAPFLGFGGAQAFLAELAAHNDREWFHAHKKTYETVYKTPAAAFVAELRPRVEALVDGPVAAKVFRIHRDTRFSKNKTPYHTYLRISFHPETPAGEPRRRGGLYFGLVASNVAAGAGAFDFDGEDLDRYRRAVADEARGKELADLLGGLESGQIHEPQLKRVPAPYPPDHPRGDLLRRKDLTAFVGLDDPALIASPALADWAMARFEAVQPVNDWLTEALAP